MNKNYLNRLSGIIKHKSKEPVEICDKEDFLDQLAAKDQRIKELEEEIVDLKAHTGYQESYIKQLESKTITEDEIVGILCAKAIFKKFITSEKGISEKNFDVVAKAIIEGINK